MSKIGSEASDLKSRRSHVGFRSPSQIAALKKKVLIETGSEPSVYNRSKSVYKRSDHEEHMSAKDMLFRSVKKDKTAEKMSFVTGPVHASMEQNEDIDELLEELLDQLDAMPELSDELLEEYTEIYLLIDPKNEGYIDAPKLFNALHMVGFDPTEAEVMDIIDAVDINKSEKIEFVELVDMMLSRDQPTLDTKELRDAFCLFDADEDGIISADDVKPLFSRFGYDLDDEEINDIIMVADYNNDGLVTMEDFVHAVKRQSEKPYKNFDWETVMNEDDAPVGAAFEYKLEDDYFDFDNPHEEEEGL